MMIDNGLRIKHQIDNRMYTKVASRDDVSVLNTYFRSEEEFDQIARQMDRGICRKLTLATIIDTGGAS